MIAFDIPYPPSVNSIWRRAGRNTVLSAGYKKWKRAAGLKIMVQRVGRGLRRIEGPFHAEITLDWQQRRGDCDNRIKATLDLLQSMGIIDDDKDCERVSIGYGTAPEGARVVVSAA